MSKHTPGPWEVRNDREIWSENRGKKYDDIAAVRPGIALSEIDKANARLIAAAPEMLERLQEVTDCLSDITSAINKGDRWGWDYEKVIEDAHAAIAKAKGE